MLYFNGFSLQNEEIFFKQYIPQSDFCVAGFSYGAQKAFEYAYHTTKRIDRLILLSPAFFQIEKPSFLRTQLHYFQKDKEAYIKQFLSNVTAPYKEDILEYVKPGNKEELTSLLSYEWDRLKIKELQNRGITIEVFLGADDKIINIEKTLAFFSDITTTYLIKDVGHLLRS
jgi:surfactin synthase thioesterase subunit